MYYSLYLSLGLQMQPMAWTRLIVIIIIIIIIIIFFFFFFFFFFFLGGGGGGGRGGKAKPRNSFPKDIQTFTETSKFQREIVNL